MNYSDKDLKSLRERQEKWYNLLNETLEEDNLTKNKSKALEKCRKMLDKADQLLNLTNSLYQPVSWGIKQNTPKNKLAYNFDY